MPSSQMYGSVGVSVHRVSVTAATIWDAHLTSAPQAPLCPFQSLASKAAPRWIFTTNRQWEGRSFILSSSLLFETSVKIPFFCDEMNSKYTKL